MLDMFSELDSIASLAKNQLRDEASHIEDLLGRAKELQERFVAQDEIDSRVDVFGLTVTPACRKTLDFRDIEVAVSISEMKSALSLLPMQLLFLESGIFLSSTTKTSERLSDEVLASTFSFRTRSRDAKDIVSPSAAYQGAFENAMLRGVIDGSLAL